MTDHDKILFTRHRGPVTCAAGVPGSPWILTSGYDGAVALFPPAGSPVRLLGYHEHLVNRVAVNSSGTVAASSSSDYTIRLWDLPSGRLRRVLRGHSDDVEDFVFVSDELGASASRDWRILLWDLRGGSILAVMEGHEKDALSIDHHAGRLYTSGDDMTLRVWDVATGRQLKVWGPFDSETDTCALDPRHGRVVLGCDDGCVRVFDLTTGEPVGERKAHTSGIKKVAVSRQRGDVLSAAYDQRVLIWDAATLEQKVSLAKRPSLWERSFNWSPDGTRILAGTFDGTVLTWDAASGECTSELGATTDPEGNACFNEAAVLNDREVALVSDDGRVRLARLTESEASWLARVEPASGRVLMNAVAADPRTGRILTGAHDHTLHIFDRVGDALRNEIEVPLGEGPINSIRVARHAGLEGTAFIACYSGAVVRVSREGRVEGKWRVHENAVKALRLHPERPLGVSCSADGVLVSWDLAGRPLTRFAGPTAIVDDVDIDPAGRRIASVGRDFVLRVHDLDDGRLLHTISLGRRSPKAVCFYDAEVVIVANYWGELLKATLSTGRVLRRQVARNGASSIGRMGDDVVVTSYDGGVYRVRAHDLTIVQTLRAMTQRVDGGPHEWR